MTSLHVQKIVKLWRTLRTAALHAPSIICRLPREPMGDVGGMTGWPSWGFVFFEKNWLFAKVRHYGTLGSPNMAAAGAGGRGSGGGCTVLAERAASQRR